MISNLYAPFDPEVDEELEPDEGVQFDRSSTLEPVLPWEDDVNPHFSTPELAIEDIIDNFNWDVVAAIMQLMNWKWVITDSDLPTEEGRPSFMCMVKTCRKELARAAASKRFPYHTETGGFCFRAWSPTHLRLDFIPATWNTLE